MKSLFVSCMLILAGCGANNRGPACESAADCQSAGARCLYRIADGCGASGECIEGGYRTCNLATALCGCNGSGVAGGCSFPEGYASGPTTGASGVGACP